MDETKEFSKAIEIARQMTDESDTLIVVTADHEHAFTFSGYSDRGIDIFGIADTSDKDYKPFSTLSYSNGPGYEMTYDKDVKDDSRLDITDYEFTDPRTKYSATVPSGSETHGGEDVGGDYDLHYVPCYLILNNFHFHRFEH